MSVIFTFPGKIGDALLQWPVAYQYARQSGKRITVWLDAGTLKPLGRLLATQACVECVEFKPGIQSYNCGGQPWDFGLKTEDFIGHVVHHMGFRRFPERQITLQTLLDSGLQLDQDKLSSEPSIKVEPLDPAPAQPYVVLHGTFQRHTGGVPRFWYFLDQIEADLIERFTKVYFTGSEEERQRAIELYPQWSTFDDNGDFYELARLMSGAALVVGAGSCGVALAGALKTPSIRVHDPIQEFPKVIWSNLGTKQWNEQEITLRVLWDDILKDILGLKTQEVNG